MKTNKTIKKILRAGLVITILFFCILLFHIITAKPAVYESPNLQVSRIDFKENIDSVQARQICSDLRSIKGLTSDSIIVKRNVVVYFHNNKITNSEKVYNELMSKRPYDAKRYILPANLANKEVCPVNQNSMSYKLSQKINQFFN
ncbi:beta/gamma crystallin family protein [Flavobacterium hibisci]|uniref:beta/gamma crystallin family protein n=1 Tax=Flavobacterium hibisci TaxID=1914462 RepID=UPI001CBBC162|nr:beta/gamma crystallin family protein [Flavobacterium hibisci]MBZ4044011.1 beta/gamma crystallin family protein [Flavobacterium hibisci]